MTKFPLARGYCYSCEDYGYDNLGENSPASIIDYSVMAGSQASKQGFVGVRGLGEF